jgi:hypothetical protein
MGGYFLHVVDQMLTKFSPQLDTRCSDFPGIGWSTKIKMLTNDCDNMVLKFGPLTLAGDRATISIVLGVNHLESRKERRTDGKEGAEIR